MKIQMIPMNESKEAEEDSIPNLEEDETDGIDQNYWLDFLDRYQHEGIVEHDTPYGHLTDSVMQGRHKIPYKDRFDYLQEHAHKK